MRSRSDTRLERVGRYLGVALLFGLMAYGFSLASAADPADYEYSLTVAVDNQSGTSVTDTPMAVLVNPAGFVSGSFLQDDAEDWLPVDVSQTELQGVAQGMTSNSQPWWFDIDQTDGTLALYTFHMGDVTAVRDQRFRFDGTTDSITVTDHADLDITDDLLIEADIELVTWPAAAGTSYLIQKSSSYEIEIGRFAGSLSITGKVTSAGDSQTVVTVLDDENNAFATGVEYAVGLYYDKDAASDNLIIYINDVSVNTESFTDALASTASDVVIGAGINGYVDSVIIDPPVLKESVNTGGDDSLPTVFAQNAIAQTFTASETYLLTNVRLNLQASGEPDDISLQLYSLDGNDYPDESLSSAIAVDVSGVSTSTPVWISFPLTPPYEVQSGTGYGLVMTNGDTAAGEIEWQADSSSPSYAGGRALASNAARSVWFSGFASVTALNYQVATDDGDFSLRDRIGGVADEYVGNALPIGHSQIANHDHFSTGVRFIGVTVPNFNVRVIEGYLTATPQGSKTKAMVSNIHGQLLGNPLGFSTAADFVSRSRTTVHADYIGLKAWTVDVETNLTSMPLVVQEVVEQVGWASGQAMVYFIDQVGGSGVNTLDAREYETDPAQAYKLHIEYVDDDDATGDFLFETYGLGGDGIKARFEFEPDEMASTQTGKAGNSWIWEGTVTDISTAGQDHSATYSLSRDLSGFTTWVYDLGSKELPAPDPTPVPNDPLGPVDLTPIATQPGIQFLFRPELENVLEDEDIGVTNLAAWFVFLTGMGLAVSAGLFWWSKSEVVVAIPLPGAYWIGYGLGTPIPLWLPIIFTLVAIGVAIGVNKFREG